MEVRVTSSRSSPEAVGSNPIKSTNIIQDQINPRFGGGFDLLLKNKKPTFAQELRWAIRLEEQRR